MLLTEQLLALTTCQIASQTPRVLDLKRLRQVQAQVSTLIKLVWRLQQDAVVFQRAHLRLGVSGCGWGMVVQQCNMLAATETLQIGTGLCPLLPCQLKPQSHHINQEEVGDG